MGMSFGQNMGLILQTHNHEIGTSYGQNMVSIFQTHNPVGVGIWAKHGVDITNLQSQNGHAI